MTRCERPGAEDSARGMLRGRRCSAAPPEPQGGCLEAGPARLEVKQMWASAACPPLPCPGCRLSPCLERWADLRESPRQRGTRVEPLAVMVMGNPVMSKMYGGGRKG